MHNYDELKMLNPNMALMIRTCDNAMPAVTAELEWTVQDVIRFMLQTGKFRDADGALSQSRIEAAHDYLATDWTQLIAERYNSPGFDPEGPDLDETMPDWKDDPQIQHDLAKYFAMKKNAAEQLAHLKSGPNKEYWRAENAILMCQRVDLWCAGPKEVERAVQHLYKLGRMLNERETILPDYIVEFAPGREDMEF